MLFQTPPAEVHLVRVFDRFGEATDSSEVDHKPVLGLFLSDPQDHQRAAEFLATGAGVHMRADANVFFPAIADIAKAQKSIKTTKYPGHELAITDPSIDISFEVELKSGSDLLQQLKGAAIPTDMLRTRPNLVDLQQKHPSINDLDRFLAFGDARLKDSGAGAKEPYRSWLMSLLKADPGSEMGNWAAFRLVEAGAPLFPGDLSPIPIALKQGEMALAKEFGGKYSGSPYLFDWEALGKLRDISDDAPYLETFRQQMLKAPQAFSISLYGFIARHLSQKDRAWILGCWKAASSIQPGKDEDPEMHPAYWIAADWLVAFGAPEDWQDFLHASTANAWGGPLFTLMGRLNTVPIYWNRRSVDASSNSIDFDAFWKIPEEVIRSLGVSQRDFEVEGVSYPTLKREPLFQLAYPAKAILGYRKAINGSVSIRCQIDTDGKVAQTTPLPSYGLHLFAPDLLIHIQKTVFAPGSIGGKRISAPFLYRGIYVGGH